MVETSCGGWTVSALTTVAGITASTSNAVPFATPFPGGLTRACWLQYTSSIVRTLDVMIGATYHITFYTTLRDNQQTTPATFQVMLGDTIVFTGLPSSTAWVQYTSSSVVATSSSMDLTFSTTANGAQYQDMGLNAITLYVTCPANYIASWTVSSGCVSAQLITIPTALPTLQTSPTSRRLSIPTNAYLGCYVDETNGARALSTQLYFNQAGYKACFALAQSQGYRYVGFEAWNQGSQSGTNAGECWGGNDLTSAEGQGVASNCALEASKDGNIMWGGGGLASFALYDLSMIFNTPTSSPDTVPLPSGQPSSAPTSLVPAAFKYLGCYGDNVYQLRIFPVYITNSGSYQSCFSQARLMGYRYVGLEYWNQWSNSDGSGQCLAGSGLAFAEGQGLSSSCVQAATTDGNIMWGNGGNSAAVYDLSPMANPTTELTSRPPYTTGSSGVPVWCSWLFISCDPQTNAVVTFDTTGSSNSWAHVTTIPSEFGSLRSLQRLSLNSMGLSSTIPASIFTSLNQLTYLNLAQNSLTGVIPSSINVAFVPQKSVLQLDLSYNALTGPVPTAFTSLQYMYLGTNKMQWSTYYNCFLTSPIQSMRNVLKPSQGNCLSPHSPGSYHDIMLSLLMSAS